MSILHSRSDRSDCSKTVRSVELNGTITRLPVDLSDEASQAAEGGREEGCADSSSVAPLYTLLFRPPAL